ncbi:hypothetical protein sos41_18400 [Alphaproteobacteria bacterium SO-S41]|nr:hypothetical protein sos41_18400 [Alphaproteobacteria bacterium SO-S41]
MTLGVKPHRSKWRESVLICRKCSKKLRGGFGKKGKRTLRGLLKDVYGDAKGRRAELGIVEVPCFKLCPKRAVSVALGTKPGTLYEVPEGMDVGDVLEALNIPAVVGNL